MAKRGSRVLMISIDGVAPSYVNQQSMPSLCTLALAGASTFGARTVSPPWTLPAHCSMLRGIAPDQHGLYDNTPATPSDRFPSFLKLARDAGHSTAAAINWSPLNGLVEPKAVDDRYFLDGGYGPEDDDKITRHSIAMLADAPEVMFSYLADPDLAGHDSGWGSTEYLNALGRADEKLGRLVAAAGPETAILVTTDHGGHAQTHDGSDPVDYITFLTLRSPGVAPASTWPDQVSVLDVAPTVAALAGFEPADAWSGTSLLEGVVPIADVILELVEQMAEVSYGESVSMLEHGLQTAAVLAERGATEELQLAGLLHDIGHLAGPAGQWGRPDHADDGARHLQAWLPPSVVEPIRLHVEAKRYLVATDPSYSARLSEASHQTLLQQGGPHTDAQAHAFGERVWADAGIELRTADDDAKVPDASVPRAGDWRAVLERVLNEPAPPVAWLRDSCVCPECRDPLSGQRLLHAGDSDGWRVGGQRDGSWVLQHQHGGEHVVTLAPTTRAGSRLDLSPVPVRRQLPNELDDFRRDLVATGLAVGTGLASESGEVLKLAAELGFVRHTNYGELFEVRNEPDAVNLAYTTLGLPLHTDNPYRDPVPTVQLLHCLVPADLGGDSLFVDGFAAADQLRDADPAAFEVLASIDVPFEYRSDNAWLRALRRIIDTDSNRNVVGVAINHRSMQPIPLERGFDLDRWNRAYRAFVELLEAPGRGVEIHLEAGEVVAFDNNRVLHARTGFATSQPRHLQGCYIDIDAVRSDARLATTR